MPATSLLLPWLIGADSEATFRTRYATLLQHWLCRMPASMMGGPVIAWHLATAWQEWVLAPVATFGTESLPVSLPETLFEEFDPADPWLQTAPLADICYYALTKRLGHREQRMRGLVFTPRSVADFLVAHVEADVTPPVIHPLRILEPSAGGGVFWAALIAHRLQDTAPHEHAAVYADLLTQHLFAIERDPLLAALIDVRARVAWYAYQLQHQTLTGEMPQPPEALTPHILCRDALADEPLPVDWPARFDLVIGNPPYGFAESMSFAERTDLKARYAVARGPFDRAWVFTEQAIRWTAPGGTILLLVPDAMLFRPRAEAVRTFIEEQMLMQEYSALGIVFPDATVGGSYFIATRRAQPVVLTDGSSAWPRLALPGPGPTIADFCTVRRGEELGDSACLPLDSQPGLTPIVRGRDLTSLGPVQPRVGIARPLRKPTLYGDPKLLVVKTGSVPVVAVDLTSGVAVLQSVYVVRLREGAPDWVSLPLLGWLLTSPAAQERFTELTKGKVLFPQLNQEMLSSFALPSVETMRRCTDALHDRCPRFMATGVMPPDEFAAAVALADTQLPAR